MNKRMVSNVVIYTVSQKRPTVGLL